MKLKDMVYLHEVSTMREFLENNGVVEATDSEIQAFYDVFEGHGYDLFARNLKDNKFIRFDSCGSELGDIDETNEDYVSINDIGYELSYGWEMLEELYEEYWGNGEEEQALDCGIAMKSLGSDIAISASDIVLLDDNISNVRKAINISKKTMNVVKSNIVLSIFVKVLVMILAMIIKLPIWIAIIADVGVCMLAILNSLTIFYGKYRK